MNISPKSGLYFHIPFCKNKCGYCDFYSVTELKNTGEFLNSLIHEIELTAQKQKINLEFDTIYFGGGTPSILSAVELEKILNTVYNYFSISENVEITLETNPGTVDRLKLISFSKLGINRLSIGVQSFINHELLFLERIHSAEEAERCFYLARECGFTNIGIDLIYALASQKREDLLFSLNKCTNLYPEHISAYNLIFEEGTPFFDLLHMGKIKKQNQKTEASFFNLTDKVLTNAGYKHYEISNYAISDNYISRHNYKYWDHIPYISFGPSAHSFYGNKRWANFRSLSQYIKYLQNGKLPIEFIETLKTKELMFEHIYLKLRTAAGVNLQLFKKQFKKDFLLYFKNTISGLFEKKLAKTINGYFLLTRKGMLLCDEILPEFAQN